MTIKQSFENLGICLGNFSNAVEQKTWEQPPKNMNTLFCLQHLITHASITQSQEETP